MVITKAPNHATITPFLCFFAVRAKFPAIASEIEVVQFHVFFFCKSFVDENPFETVCVERVYERALSNLRGFRHLVKKRVDVDAYSNEWH